MPDVEKHDFVIEKIKERPVSRKKLLRNTLITASMAVIFGLIACVTFLTLEPVISNWLYPEEEPQLVLFPEDQEEMSPEEMLSDTMQEQEAESPPGGVELEQIEHMLSDTMLDKDGYQQLYRELSEYTEELRKSMVTITSTTSDIDWFNNVQESSNQSSGVIIANNGRELLILADYGTIEDAERFTVTFFNGYQAQASMKKCNVTTNLVVMAVDIQWLEDEVMNGIVIPKFGSSNTYDIVGKPVIALGSPMGAKDSVSYGMITANSNTITMADANYRLLYTNIYGSRNASGALFNLRGELIGIITNQLNGDMENLITAYGMDELRKLVQKLSNGMSVAYLGIKGIGVSDKAYSEMGVPFGAYILEVEMDSPAMFSGISKGDVIVSMNGQSVLNFQDYTSILMGLSAGEDVELTVKRLTQDEYKEMNFTVTLKEVE